jgi:hypothetical protein
VLTDTKSAKNTDKLSVIFALLGSARRVKAARRTLMKLTLGRHNYVGFLRKIN